MDTRKQKKAHTHQVAFDIFDTLDASYVKHFYPIRMPSVGETAWNGRYVANGITIVWLMEKGKPKLFSRRVWALFFLLFFMLLPFITPWCGHRAIAHYTNYALNERWKKSHICSRF